MEKIKKMIGLMKEIMLGAEIDFTKGKISRAIFLLAVPMIAEMIMESIFVIVDIYFVSMLGTEAVTAVGLTESVMTLVFAVAVGLSVATTAIIARRIGEKKPEKASEAAFQAIVAGVIASAVIAIVGIFFSEDLLYLMGAEKEVVDIGKSYTSIMFSGNVVIMLLFIINAIFRSSGDAIISMVVLGIANILNIILDPIFIFGFGPIPGYGVQGAAIATNIGRGVAVLIQLYILFFGTRKIKLAARHVKIRIKVILDIFKLSGGSLMQNIIATTSWIILVWIMAKFGTDSVAGYTVAVRIIIFVLLPAWGMSNAAATLAGQNLGAGQAERAERSVWISGFANMIFMGVVSIFLIIFSESIIQLFQVEPSVLSVGSEGLRYFSYGFIAYALGMVLVQSFNGAGDTYTPMFINIVAFWMIEMPLAYFLALKLGFEEKGVFIAVLVSEIIMTTLGVILFKRGKWKLKKV
jgi:putative MATE family efflux protein